MSLTVACTFFCSCCSTLLSPCLLCVSGPFLLLSVDNCTSCVGGDCFVNRARRYPPGFQSTEAERQVADYNVAETRTTRECLRLLLHTSALVVWLVVAFALSFVCSCRSILIISVLQCLLAFAWIVPQVLLSIDIAVTLPSLCFWPFLVTVR